MNKKQQVSSEAKKVLKAFVDLEEFAGLLSKMGDVEQEIVSTEAQISINKVAVAKLKDESEDWRSQIASEKKEAGAIKKELVDKAKQKAADIVAQAEAHKDQLYLEVAADKIREKDNEIKNLRAMLAQANSAKEASVRKVVSLEEKNNSLSDKLTALQSNLKSMVG